MPSTCATQCILLIILLKRLFTSANLLSCSIIALTFERCPHLRFFWAAIHSIFDVFWNDIHSVFISSVWFLSLRILLIHQFECYSRNIFKWDPQTLLPLTNSLWPLSCLVVSSFNCCLANFFSMWGATLAHCWALLSLFRKVLAGFARCWLVFLGWLPRYGHAIAIQETSQLLRVLRMALCASGACGASVPSACWQFLSIVFLGKARAGSRSAKEFLAAQITKRSLATLSA